jgi:hypothetical protein
VETSLLSERNRAGIFALWVLLLTVSCSLLENNQEADLPATKSQPASTIPALKVVTPLDPAAERSFTNAAGGSLVPPPVPLANTTPENLGAAAATGIFQLTNENAPEVTMAEPALALATVAPLIVSETEAASRAPSERITPTQTPPPAEVTTHAGTLEPGVRLSSETPSAANSPPAATAATAVTRPAPVVFHKGLDNHDAMRYIMCMT